jgi:Tfp pilus assembly protein PilF
MKTLIFIILLISVSCSSQNKEQQLSAKEKKTRLYYNQGTQDLTNADYTSALNNLLFAYELAPKDSKVLNNLGMAYYFKKSTARAIGLIKEAIELDPKNADAKVNLGTIYLNSNRLALARSIYTDLLKNLTYKGQYRTYFNLAVIDAKEGKIESQIRNLNLAIQENDGYCSAHFELGKVALKQKQPRKALKHFKDATHGTCYEHGEPHIAKVQTLLYLKDYFEAQRAIDDIIERFAMTKFEEQARYLQKQLNKSLNSRRLKQ